MDKVAKREPAPGEKSSIPGKTPTVKAVAAGIKKREGEGIQNKPGGAPEGIKPIKRSANKHIKPRKPE